MHIIGNLCKAILRQLFGYHEATPALKERNCAACKQFNMHEPQWDVDVRAPWILSPAECIEFKRRITLMRFPTRYAEDLAPKFSTPGKEKPRSMKTHSRMKLLLHILPIALQGLGSSLVHEACVDLSRLLRYVFMIYIMIFKVGNLITYSLCYLHAYTHIKIHTNIICKLYSKWYSNFNFHM